MSYRGPLIRTVAFLTAALFLGLMTWRLLAGSPLPPQTMYRAAFTDVSNLSAGDQVKVAGVAVGEVEKIDLDLTRNQAHVTFGVSRSLTLTDQTRAEIKYKNLTGDRYLSLTPGIAPVGRAATGTDLGQVAATTRTATSRSQGNPLKAGGEIPVGRTTPALDLDALFGGFQPLFEALTPQQVNRLSNDLVQVLQGEGGTVVALLRDVADFTTTLADRNVVIGQVITNLNVVLGSMNKQSDAFEQAVVQAQNLVTGLSGQRKQLAAGLDATTQVSKSVATTLGQVRPELASTSGQVRRLSALLTTKRNAAVFTQKFNELPDLYRLMAGFGSYGAWSNFYLCGLGLQADGGINVPMTLVSDLPRCKK
jgi:phospholipid/cholesterol/gamma-HCH transport system substrate-binding protein